MDRYIKDCKLDSFPRNLQCTRRRDSVDLTRHWRRVTYEMNFMFPLMWASVGSWL
jgi:hypothetical protein